MDPDHDRASGPLASTAGDLASVAVARDLPGPGRQPGGDTLSAVLEAVRLTGALFFVVDASTPWVAEAPSSARLAPAILPRAQHVVSYHVVTRGACWCELSGTAPVGLEAGDVIVIPHGDEYALTSTPGLRSGFTPEQLQGWFRDMAGGHLPFVVDEGGGGAPRIGIICGFLGCDALPFNPVLSTLPRLLHLRRPDGTASGPLNALIELAVHEARERRAGARSILLRLGELMFVEVVRRHLSTADDRSGGWIAGLRDPVVGRALMRLHEEPSRAWTLDELARDVGASRTVLAERFTHFVGQPLMQYLTRWRLQLAARRLEDRAAKIAAVAQEVGYDSEAAFSRAFKKLTGVPPAAWRNRRQTHGCHRG